MDQAEFSKLAENYIRRHYSNIVSKINYHEDGSFDCMIHSANRSLSIWIATYDTEITVGFEDADENSGDWHTHMSLWGAHNPEEELNAMSQLIDSIISDSEPIVFSSKLGYYLTDDLDAEKHAASKDEKVDIRRWSEL